MPEATPTESTSPDTAPRAPAPQDAVPPDTAPHAAVSQHDADDHALPEFEPRDLWAGDGALRAALAREGAEAFAPLLQKYGRLAGDAIYRLSFDAHRDRPRLRNFDRQGRRIDRVDFHPAYHAIFRSAVEAGVAGLSWAPQRWGMPKAGAHVARAALSYLHYQVEPGTSCPLTMTHAAVPVLARVPQLAVWAEKAAMPDYDPQERPIAEKRGITLGMGMTEKQGGSDVRRNRTRAEPLAEDGQYALTGHKWFFSAPMSDGFLVLAQAPGGLSCFLMPRMREEGSRNAFRLLRLKDKLGDWSNASSEVEFDRAHALRVGEEGRGIATILEMVMLTRLDCMLGSAGAMRMALVQALHHARHRVAFGRRLIDQPLMRNVLADLALESEAATVFAMLVAGAVDRADSHPLEAAFARIATAIGKYWVCKRAPGFINEAQECLGGAGYIEESLLPRLYRQAPLNSIWEGSGNIQCLDVLRALKREPDTGRALFAFCDGFSARSPLLAAELERLRAALAAAVETDAEAQQAGARALVERMALALQAAALLRADSAQAEDFIVTRLSADGRGQAYGTLPAGIDLRGVLVRSEDGVDDADAPSPDPAQDPRYRSERNLERSAAAADGTAAAQGESTEAPVEVSAAIDGEDIEVDRDTALRAWGKRLAAELHMPFRAQVRRRDGGLDAVVVLALLGDDIAVRCRGENGAMRTCGVEKLEFDDDDVESEGAADAVTRTAVREWRAFWAAARV